MKNNSPNVQRKPWYLLTGIVIGFCMGLVFSWLLFPVEYVDTPPSSLRDDLKQSYRSMIALSYAVNQDINRAKLRLQILDSPQQKENSLEFDAIPTSIYLLEIQAQQALAENRVETELRSLSLLAAALRPTPTHTTTPITTISTKTPTNKPTNISPTPFKTAILEQKELSSSIVDEMQQTQTIQPVSSTNPTSEIRSNATQTSQPTPPANFSLQSRKLICDPTLTTPKLQIQVLDENNQPIAGVRAILQWKGGKDTFITGMKSEMGDGYADYTLQPDVSYSLLVGEGGEKIQDIKIETCESSRLKRYGGTWLFTFKQLP